MTHDTSPRPIPSTSPRSVRDPSGTSPRRGPRRVSALAGTLLAATLGSGAVRAADVTVAFLGDQSTHGTARDVLEMVRDAGADLLVLGGDFGYSRPERWVANMDEILGPRFPVLAVVGNHEDIGWPMYADWLERRIDEVDGLSCEGRVGVKATCTFRGISVVQVAPGVHEVPGISGSDDYAGYLRDALADDPNAWRICSWHKLQRDMQVGSKTGNATGWDVYEECRKGGGIVATAHEHSYSRTHLMSDFSDKRVVHERDHLEIGPGQTFAFVSGLGGKSVRPQQRGGDWWASVYTATQGATHGALLCTFGDARASCRFQAIDGSVPDRFTLESRNGIALAAGPRSRPDTPTPGPRDDGGSDAEREPAPETDPGVPAVSGLRSSVYSSRTAELFWNRLPAPVVGYEIRRNGEVIGTKNGTSYMDRGLGGRRDIVHEVVALDADGNRGPAATVTTNPSGDRPPAAAVPSAPATPPSGSADEERVDVTRGSTIVPGDIDVRLDVYDRRSYELIWERMPGATRYRLTTFDGRVVLEEAKLSQYFRNIDSSLETGYRLEALDANGTTLHEVRVLVAPRRSAQLSAVS